MGFLKWLFSETKHDCPNCKTELTAYGSHPWGLWEYICEKCNYKEPDYGSR